MAKTSNWRGCSDIKMKYYNDWADPDLIATINGKEYVFNYYDIEDALWDMFLDYEGLSERDTYDARGHISDEYEKQFSEFCQAEAYDYLEDVVYGGYFEIFTDDVELESYVREDEDVVGHPEVTNISYQEYQDIKSDLLRRAKALCKSKGYWCVCVAIKNIRNWYMVNLDTGYLFTANSETEYNHKLEDWDFDGALVITVYAHDDITEGCGRKKKSKKKKVLNQGCSSKEGCGSKRRVAKEDSYDDWEGDDGRYVIGKDFNTKDWFIYDNVTDKNVCWCDTEEEAIEVAKTLPSSGQKSESHKRKVSKEGRNSLHHYFDDLDERFDFDLEDEFDIYLGADIVPCYVVDSTVFGNGAGLSYTIAIPVGEKDHWQMDEWVERGLEEYFADRTDGSDYTFGINAIEKDDYVYGLPNDVDNYNTYVAEVEVVPFDNIGFDGYGINAGVNESKRR